MANLARHVENVQKFGLPPVVSINRFTADTDAEITLVEEHAKSSASMRSWPTIGRWAAKARPTSRARWSRRSTAARAS